MAGMVDTLKVFEKLRAAGLDEPAARAIAEGQFEAIAGSFATKADLELTKAELRSGIRSLRAEVRHLSGRVKGLYVYVTLAVAIMAALGHWRVI